MAPISVDELPYLDPAPLSSALAAAHDLITADLASNPPPNSTLHPSLRALPPSAFTPLITASLPSENNTPGLDLSRYSAPEPPEQPSTTTWPPALTSAQTNASHLALRSTNLSLLEAHGRNAWLVSNSALEDELRALERAVAEGKEELARVGEERRQEQERFAGEVAGLTEGWRGGVRRLVEVQVAGEKVREEVRRVKRERATGGE